MGTNRHGIFLTTACICVLISETGCDDGASPIDPKAFDKNLEEHRAACVEKINAFRSTLALPPYERWTDGESCADDAAKADASKDEPHGAFQSCEEVAQNECPGWGSVDKVFEGCFQMMWDEGPGEDYTKHGHYTAMAHELYTQVACGFHVTDGGEVWAVQNFR